jgi:predicted dehydrogenase
MRIGFIGLGWIAGVYREGLQRIEQPISAVFDIKADQVAKFAAETGAAPYHDYREMLARERLDAVFISIPPGAHASQVADAAQAGAAAFVAKPIALDLELAVRTREAIAASGVINQVGYMARYSDIAERARELLDGRELGLALGRFLCRMGATHPWWGKRAISGGQMLEQSTHVFDLMRYFLGEVGEVQAFGHAGLGADIADFEDSTVANLRFKSGAVGNVASTYTANAPDGFAVELAGRDCYLKLVMDLQLRGQVDNQPVEFDGKETGYFRQVEQFIRAVERHDPRLVRSSYADAVRTLAVTLAANRSLETGRAAAVEEV